MGVFGAGLAIAAASGCGSSVANETDGTGGGGTTSSTTSGTTSSTTTGTGGGPCAAFADQEGAASVTVRFRNESPYLIYLPGNCSDVDYSIELIGGGDQVAYTYDGSCLQTCEDLQTDPPYACGACAPIAYLLEPGATRELTWAGTGLEWGLTMPDACWAYPEGIGTCGQIVAAPAGTYRAGAMGFDTCADCQCDPGGECFGYPTGAQAYPDLVTFEFPADATVEILFGACAFGCP